MLQYTVLFHGQGVIASSQKPWHIISSFQTRTMQTREVTWPVQGYTA